MHCLASQNLRRYNREYCRRIRLQLNRLYKDHQRCDEVIHQHLTYFYIYPHDKLPYDPCEACVNNTHMLEMHCIFDRIYDNKDCQIAQNCVIELNKTFAIYPFVLAESNHDTSNHSKP